MTPVLSYIAAQELLAGRSRHLNSVQVSLDLNRTTIEVGVGMDAVTLPDGQRIAWSRIEQMAETEAACWTIKDGLPQKVQRRSEATGRFYSLLPTRGAPTMLLSGIPMHRIKAIDPWEDTLRKMRTIAPVIGHVLDVCTGLGYTAIAAARTAERVTTIELDPTVLELCALNPWSQELFANPRIERRLGDATEVLPELPPSAFSRIFHDPPTLRVAGELYAGAVYRDLFRLLRRGGRLFHYIGDLDSTTGRVVAKGVVRRLQEAGFERVDRCPEAFGLTAAK